MVGCSCICFIVLCEDPFFSTLRLYRSILPAIDYASSTLVNYVHRSQALSINQLGNARASCDEHSHFKFF